MGAAWRSGRWEATPTVGFRSPVPRPTISNVSTRFPAGPAMEVRSPPGRGKGRSRSRSAATSTMWAPPRPGRTTRLGERPPPGATRRRWPGHGGSAVAMGPLWGSQPLSARRRRSRGGRVAPRLHRHRRNAHNHRGGRRRTAASNSTATANTAAPGDAATTTIAARAAGPAPAVEDALSGRAPQDDRGIFLREVRIPRSPREIG
jgi:hypothetical protein